MIAGKEIFVEPLCCCAGEGCVDVGRRRRKSETANRANECPVADADGPIFDENCAAFEDGVSLQIRN